MSNYKARYQGSNEEILCEGETPRMSVKTFIKKIGFKPLPVEVWDDRWIVFDSHISQYQEKEKTKNQEKVTESNQQNFNEGSRDAISSFTDQKLDKIYDVLNHIRWIGLGIGGMFALTFIVPQCTGG